jgi:hypothetical protein
MYDFVNRFSQSDDESTVTSLEQILGGPGWRQRLDPDLPRGPGVEKLFRETLKSAGNFSEDDKLLLERLDQALTLLRELDSDDVGPRLSSSRLSGKP